MEEVGKGAIRGQIYAHLYGGLGNQLFQAGFAHIIQTLSGAELNLIVEGFKNDGLRQYLLSSFPRLRAKIVPLADAEGASVIDERNVRT